MTTTKWNRRRVLTAVGSAAVGSFAGCLGNEGDPSGSVERAEVSTRTDDGEVFDPAIVHVEVGGTVAWVVESGSHDTFAYHPETHGPQQRIPDAAEPWATDPMNTEENSRYERTFDVEGVYDYLCTPHEPLGMIGSVVVGWPDPATEPGLQLPAEAYSEIVRETLSEHNERGRNPPGRGVNSDTSVGSGSRTPRGCPISGDSSTRRGR